MGLAGNSATFMRRAKRSLHHFLALVLAASTLSAISVISTPSARALSNGDCAPTVGTAGSVTATAVGSDVCLFSAGIQLGQFQQA